MVSPPAGVEKHFRQNHGMEAAVRRGLAPPCGRSIPAVNQWSHDQGHPADSAQRPSRARSWQTLHGGEPTACAEHSAESRRRGLRLLREVRTGHRRTGPPVSGTTRTSHDSASLQVRCPRDLRGAGASSRLLLCRLTPSHPRARSHDSDRAVACSVPVARLPSATHPAKLRVRRLLPVSAKLARLSLSLGACALP